MAHELNSSGMESEPGDPRSLLHPRRWKYTLPILVLVLTSVSPLIFIQTGRHLEATLAERAEADSRIRLDSAAAHTKVLFDSVRRLLAGISSDPELVGASPETQARIIALVIEFRREHPLAAVYVSTESERGFALAFAEAEAGKPASGSAQRIPESIQGLLASRLVALRSGGGGPALSGETPIPEISPGADAEEGVILSVPITRRGRVVGVVAGAILSASINEELTHGMVRRTAFLVDDKGGLIGHAKLAEELERSVRERIGRRGLGGNDGKAQLWRVSDRWRLASRRVSTETTDGMWVVLVENEALYALPGNIAGLPGHWVHALGAAALGVVLALLIYNLGRRVEDHLRYLEQHKRDEAKSREQHLQLVRADKLASLGVLVAGVAHEVNNPNEFILVNATIMRDAWNQVTPILKEYQRENGEFNLVGMPFTKMMERADSLYAGILDGSRQIKHIVQSLKEYAGEDPGERNQDVSLNAVVEAAVTLLTNLIRKHTSNFSVTYADLVPAVRGNFQQLEQVVINLLQNACQALSDSSQAVTLQTGVDEASGRVFVRVIDEGEGISAEHLQRVVDPFFTTKRDRGGTGLGLSISSRIIQEHGGTLEFKSQEGEGTTASIYLPPARSLEARS